MDVLFTFDIKNHHPDVSFHEPLAMENELWVLPNCTVSPHVSSLSGKYVDRALVIVEENLQKWLKGEWNLRNLIDPNDGYYLYALKL